MLKALAFSMFNHKKWVLFALGLMILLNVIMVNCLSAQETKPPTKPPDVSQWQANILNWQNSPVDLTFLNAQEKPAGKRGFVKAQGEQLVFADGKVAKFWGVNLAAYTLFGTSKAEVRQQAKRLSALGFNLVRIHHMDSPWVDPNIFVKSANNTKTINPESMDKLDWWIKCLKDEGIYVWLDLHVQRNFKKGDGITDFDEISQGKAEADLKGYNYVNHSMQLDMQVFNQAYLSHKNAYTGLRYTEEPAIIAALITNENDITHHYGNLLLPDKVAKAHSARYIQLAKNFAGQHGLDADQVWRAWEPGVSQLFLNDLEHQFDVNMTSHLRGIGFKAPIVTTSYWGDSPLSSLPALTDGDIIDVHAYRGFGGLNKNPLTEDNLIDWLAAGQVVGKPMSVSEWNADPFPVDDRQVLPLYVATQSSFQGWDAMMLYAYAQSPLQALQDWNHPSNWDAMYDPSMMATMPAAALIYRRGDVKEAANTYVLDLKDQLFNQNIDPKNSVLIRTATELGKLQIAMPATKALPWLKKSVIPQDAKVFNDPNQSLIKKGVTEVKNIDFQHDWQQGSLTINTQYSQGLVGTAANKMTQLKDVVMTSQTPNAVIMVQSLTNDPIAHSTNLLISLSARSVPSENNSYPYLSEPVIGELKITAPTGLKLYKKEASHQEQLVPMQYVDGAYVIHLDAHLNTYWLSLRKPNTPSTL